MKTTDKMEKYSDSVISDKKIFNDGPCTQKKMLYQKDGFSHDTVLF